MFLQGFFFIIYLAYFRNVRCRLYSYFNRQFHSFFWDDVQTAELSEMSVLQMTVYFYKEMEHATLQFTLNFAKIYLKGIYYLGDLKFSRYKSGQIDNLLNLVGSKQSIHSFIYSLIQATIFYSLSSVTTRCQLSEVLRL